METEKTDESRRDFIEKAGKAAITVPAAVILLSGGGQLALAYDHDTGTGTGTGST
jgi:formiminotetrahydrofolate cyclodeaminase